MCLYRFLLWFLIILLNFELVEYLLIEGKTCENQTSYAITGKGLKSLVNFNIVNKNLKEETNL